MNKHFRRHLVGNIIAVKELIRAKLQEERWKGLILTEELLYEILDESIKETEEQDLIDLQFQEALEKDDNNNN